MRGICVRGICTVHTLTSAAVGTPKLKLYRDKDGHLKGDALCCYLKVLLNKSQCAVKFSSSLIESLTLLKSMGYV